LLSQFVPEVYLVIDTNVLLLHLDVVRQFVDDIEAQSLPLQVIIPTAVLSELDQ
jgi:rRNA-processing protein FCF1